MTLGSNTILVMSGSTRIGSVVSDFLSSIDHAAPAGQKGHRMMLRKLRSYLWWKSQLSRAGNGDGAKRIQAQVPFVAGDDESQGISEGLKKKDREAAQRAASRRRVRGGAPGGVVVKPAPKSEAQNVVMTEMQNEADTFAEL